MRRVPRSHSPTGTTPYRPRCHRRLGLSCQPQVLGLQHMHVCGHQAGTRLDVQVRRGRNEEDTRDSRMPLHHRPLHHADQSICTRQRAPHGPAQQQDAGDTRRNFNRNAHLAGAKHKEGNPHLPRTRKLRQRNTSVHPK